MLPSRSERSKNALLKAAVCIADSRIRIGCLSSRKGNGRHTGKEKAFSLHLARSQVQTFDISTATVQRVLRMQAAQAEVLEALDKTA